MNHSHCCCFFFAVVVVVVVVVAVECDAKRLATYNIFNDLKLPSPKIVNDPPLFLLFLVVVVAVVVMAVEYDAPEEAKKRNQDTVTRGKRKVDQHT